jgi:hypothetical protein
MLGHVVFDLVGQAEELALQKRDHFAPSGTPSGARSGSCRPRLAALLVHTLLERSRFFAQTYQFRAGHGGSIRQAETDFRLMIVD